MASRYNSLTPDLHQQLTERLAQHKPELIIEEWVPVTKGSLRGFARIRLPSGMVLSDVAVMQCGAKAWAMPPGKPQIDRNGVALREETGKIRYTPIVGFANRELRSKFSDQVIGALRASYPEALS